jgi:site-specific DNA recombinase
MRIAQTSRNGNARVACAAAHQHGTCAHTKSYDIEELKNGIRDGMIEHLHSTDAIEAALEAYRDEKKQGERNDTERKAVERKLNALEVEIARAVDMTLKLNNPPAHLLQKIDVMEVERASLDERLHQLGGPIANGKVVPFPITPKFIDVYKKSVMEVHAAITNRPDAPETRAAFRDLIDSIVVHPTGKRMPYEFTPYCRIAALQGANLFPARRSTEEVIAAQGLSAVAITPSQNSPVWRYRNTETAVISLGRWRAAA